MLDKYNVQLVCKMSIFKSIKRSFLIEKIVTLSTSCTNKTIVNEVLYMKHLLAC